MGEAIEIQVDNRGVDRRSEDTADRTLYGIDGPRHRPSGSVVVIPEAEAPSSPPPERATVRERWRMESEDRSRERQIAPPSPPADLEARFEALRVVMAAELGRRIDAAVERMQETFEQEIEALRTLNREEAKRLRSANGEAFVRIRAADTQELERIRSAIDEGIERLCSVLEGQLERVWAANDVELDRIRSAGADRLAEVHDLLMHELERVRAQPPSAVRRPWYRRKERTTAD